MTISDDEDESLAHFLESEVLSEFSDQEEDEPQTKRLRVADDAGEGSSVVPSSIVQFQPPPPPMSNICVNKDCCCGNRDGFHERPKPRSIETGFFSKIPSELFHHILKFLSSEDLVSCSLVCRFLNYASSDESLWRRLYCMRWGLLPPTKKLREVAWKRLYIQRDEEDMIEFVRNCPSEFKEYYIQMQAAKRSQAPLPSQVNDDQIVLDKTVSDQVSIWKSSRGLTDTMVSNHDCSGETCTYYQIGDVFVCEKTGRVHVCDDTCREAVLDPGNELLVCTISGHCFDRLLSPAEMEPDPEQQQGGVSDEAEPFMGSGRFARAYLLGYNCADEKELQAALRFC
ncbi:F-box protein SKIP31 [Diospyros lotus]|uniref:F-box protein SKIP31 n=1 Tax=Diospyros lotus TaxID=55363 RepID=UPI0022597076|nr:F-box protein SKIP31 [Diospyros lotus]